MPSLTDIERVIVDFYEANEVPVNEAGGEWFVAGDGQFSLTALAVAIQQAQQDGPRWRHKKRGSEYIEIGKAGLQSADAIYEPATLVIYRDADGRLWARPKGEFEDGRFELMAGK